MTRPLTHRALNRATLARQMLLERSDIGIVEATRFLGGLQAQQSNDPYIALWSRLNGFRHEDLTQLIVDRVLNRATSMRGTLHLHTADDLLGIRALVEPFLKRQWKSNFLRRFGGHDPEKVLAADGGCSTRQPMTAGALQQALQEKFPGGEPLAMSTLLQLHEDADPDPADPHLGQRLRAPILTRIENWLPAPYERPLSRADLVRRYLAAFGPATVNDMRTGAGSPSSRRNSRRSSGELVVLEDVDGRTLYDLPDAPRPDADTPAPVRFLPLYDNVYLGYDNRRRMLSDGDRRLINLFQNFKPAGPDRRHHRRRRGAVSSEEGRGRPRRSSPIASFLGRRLG